MLPGRGAAVLVACLAAVGARPGQAAPRRGEVDRVVHNPVERAPTLGPRAALVTVEVFFTPGLTKPHTIYRHVVELQHRHPTRVRAVFRPIQRGAPYMQAAIVLAAHMRGRFFDLMDELASHTPAMGDSQVVEAAVRLGLERTVVERSHLDDAIYAALEDNRHRYFRSRASSNPEVIINGRPIGQPGLDELEAAYRVALDAARRAESQGVPRRALVRALWRRASCPDDDERDRGRGDDEEPDTGRLARSPDHDWSLLRMVRRGTGCPPTPHRAAQLDDYDPSAPPGDRSTPLLTGALPRAGLPSLGSAEARVPIYVVCNLAGPECGKQLERARRVSEHYGDLVRVIHVPFVDLSLDWAERDLTLAQAVLCATDQGDGWAFVRAVISHNLRDRLDLPGLAGAAGLDVDALVACAKRDPSRAREVIKAARTAGVAWGPTVVIGGRAYLGGFNDERPEASVVEAELEPGLLEWLSPSW